MRDRAVLCVAALLGLAGCSPREIRNWAVGAQDRAAQLGGDAELKRSLAQWEREGGTAATYRQQPAQKEAPEEQAASGRQDAAATPEETVLAPPSYVVVLPTQ